MKTLFFISGTMGVGKTTVSLILKDKLNKSVFLDGDSCWIYQKDKITEDVKKEVITTIVNKLNEYLACPQYENIIFCWVMHEQSIICQILSKLKLVNCSLINVSLICNNETLIQRLTQDISAGLRDKDIIQRSLDRLPLYTKLETIKINTNDKDSLEVANEIMKLKRF